MVDLNPPTSGGTEQEANAGGSCRCFRQWGEGGGVAGVAVLVLVGDDHYRRVVLGSLHVFSSGTPPHATASVVAPVELKHFTKV